MRYVCERGSLRDSITGIIPPAVEYARPAEPGFSLVVHGWLRRRWNPRSRFAQNQFPRETTTAPATRAASARA